MCSHRINENPAKKGNAIFFDAYGIGKQIDIAYRRIITLEENSPGMCLGISSPTDTTIDSSVTIWF